MLIVVDCNFVIVSLLRFLNVFGLSFIFWNGGWFTRSNIVFDQKYNVIFQQPVIIWFLYGFDIIEATERIHKTAVALF